MSTEIEVYIPRAPTALTTLGQVRTELAKVYRDARMRRIPTNEGTKLAYLLMALARIIEGGEMERRLEALEQQITTPGRVVVYEEFQGTINETGAAPD